MSRQLFHKELAELQDQVLVLGRVIVSLEMFNDVVMDGS